MHGVGTFCIRTRRILSYEEHWILRTVTYEILQVLMSCINSLCIMIALLYPVTLSFNPCPFLFQENTSQGCNRCSITCTRYCDLLPEQVIPVLQKQECLETSVFIHTQPHIARALTELLHVHFRDDRVTSRGFHKFHQV